MSELIERPELDLEELAKELALEFFPAEVIQFRHGLKQSELERLMRDPEFLRMLQDAQLDLAQSGERFQLRAAKVMNDTLEAMRLIAIDPNTSNAQRAKAAELIGRWAKYDKQDNVAVAGMLQFRLVTNLAMDQIETIDGKYTVVSNGDVEDLLG